MHENDILELFERLGLALGIGFLVGVERGWKNRAAPEGSRAAGLRTHAVAGLYGGVSGALAPMVGPIGFAALMLAFAAPWVAFKLREVDRDQDISVTGTIGGLLVVALGALAVLGDMRAASAGGVALTALLAFKAPLHHWLQKLSWEEIRSALLILAATAIALPLLPDRAVDPWGYLIPRELWLLTILVATASFFGYVVVRVLGDGAGLIAASLAGALVSSTLVTGELGRRIRSDGVATSSATAAAAWASSVSLVRLMALSAVAAGPVLPLLWKPLSVAALAYALIGWVLWRRRGPSQHRSAGEQWRNPLSLPAVVKFAALLAVAITIGRIASAHWGEAGLLPFAAGAGIADVDTVALTAGALERAGVSTSVAAHAILLAALVNAMSKAVVGAVSGGLRYGLAYGAASFVAAAAVGGLWLLEALGLVPI